MDPAQVTAPLHVRISAPSAPGPNGRWRGKPARLWTKTPVEVEVVDKPGTDGQISHASFAAIQADPYLKVEFVGGSFADDAAASELSALKARLIDAEATIAKLRTDAAAEAERFAEERSASLVAAEDLVTKFERAEGEIANLRAKLAERPSRR